MSVMNAPVAGTLPLHIVGLKNILVETLHNVGHPTRCPKPLNSVRLMVPYIVQCLHNDFFKPALCRGGVPATCANVCGDKQQVGLGNTSIRSSSIIS